MDLGALAPIWRLVAVGAALYGWSQAHQTWRRIPKPARKVAPFKTINSVRVTFGVIAVAGILGLLINPE